MADQVPAPAAGGNAAALPLPYESVVARAVFQRNHMSVVRLRVSFVTGKDGIVVDYPAAPGASGSPVFGVDGDDHRVAGLCKGGRKGVAYTVPVSCIRDALKTARGATDWPENATILEMLRLWLASSMVPPPQPAGDPAAATGAGRARPRRGTPGSGVAGPSSSKGIGP